MNWPNQPLSEEPMSEEPLNDAFLCAKSGAGQKSGKQNESFGILFPVNSSPSWWRHLLIDFLILLACYFIPIYFLR